jgi:RNA polymerase sigma-70 factor, ECF subfamily
MTSDANDEQDRADIARLNAGHDSALNSLMGRHGERLFHYLLRQLNNESEAADIAQDTFVRVYQNRARFNAAHKFSTWLYTIATNLLKDRYRWRTRHPEVSLDAESQDGLSLKDTLVENTASPSERIAVEERASEVQKAIAALPDELRTALLLSEYEDLSHAEVGAVLNCSAKAVETRLYRARTILRKRLEPVLQSRE